MHKAARVSEKMQQLDIEPVWNAVYSPQLNSIEMSFSKAKLYYKKDKLHRLAHKKPLPKEAMIRQAFSRLTKENICSYIEHCYQLLREAA